MPADLRGVLDRRCRGWQEGEERRSSRRSRRPMGWRSGSWMRHRARKTRLRSTEGGRMGLGLRRCGADPEGALEAALRGEDPRIVALPCAKCRGLRLRASWISVVGMRCTETPSRPTPDRPGFRGASRLRSRGELYLARAGRLWLLAPLPRGVVLGPGGILQTHHRMRFSSRRPGGRPRPPSAAAPPSRAQRLSGVPARGERLPSPASVAGGALVAAVWRRRKRAFPAIMSGEVSERAGDSRPLLSRQQRQRQRSSKQRPPRPGR